MVEFKSDSTNLSRRQQQLPVEREEKNEDSDQMDDKMPDDVFAKDDKTNPEVNPGLLTRLSGGVLSTASSAVGSAYGGVSWVAGGVISTTGTAIGATYNTVSGLSPLNLFRKQSKSKSD